ncbi:type II toxin-antitoxin system antitoxin SocA domain-containing protein [Tistrella sp. BH-R2-4]|uniref:Type II toxin-antitoxin system antitoxin SocA domain-containing protein n=1 Tax=Tistrella arctica TaxID=3133430 RepID=A0ABU9YJL6_9PROT
MTVDTLSAAKHLCEKSHWSLSNLKLQKVLYIAHMMHLGQFGMPLINGYFEAWDYGPVEPKLYHHVKAFGREPVGPVFGLVADVSDPVASDVLDRTFDRLSNMTPGQLVGVTHWERGAWARYYNPRVRGVLIPNDAIRSEYRERITHAE